MINGFEWIANAPPTLEMRAIQIEDLKQKSPSSYGVTLPDTLKRSVTKRQYEFVGGRLCAYEACKYFGVTQQGIEQDHFGRPLWPEGLVGSITHTDVLAIAVIGRKEHFSGVGIDSEKLVEDDEALEAIRNYVLLEDERQLARGNKNTILIFSIKESLYKCFSHHSDKGIDYADFHVVSVDEKNHSATVEILNGYDVNGGDLSVTFSVDSTFNHIHSCVVLHTGAFSTS